MKRKLMINFCLTLYINFMIVWRLSDIYVLSTLDQVLVILALLGVHTLGRQFEQITTGASLPWESSDNWERRGHMYTRPEPTTKPPDVRPIDKPRD